jgi:hypothetical protein
LNLSRSRHVEFQLVLSDFAIERLLYRLSISEYVPEGEPLALTREFMAAPERQTQWRAFLRRGRLVAPPDAGELADGLRRFLGPVLAAAAKRESPPGSWPPGGPWR